MEKQTRQITESLASLCGAFASSAKKRNKRKSTHYSKSACLLFIEGKVILEEALKLWFHPWPVEHSKFILQIHVSPRISMRTLFKRFVSVAATAGWGVTWLPEAPSLAQAPSPAACPVEATWGAPKSQRAVSLG